MAQIELKNIHKSFGNVKVIKGVDFVINDKEFVVFVGPSGCGKSTMLRLIAGLEEASDGQVFIDGEDVTALSASERGLSMVFQSYALYPHKTVGENMGFPLKVAGKSRAEINERVAEASDVLKLDSLLDRKPKDLSGGQRQRVAIGRCIVRNPKAFLFDEPLSNLDAALRVDMRVQIARLQNKLQATMVYVTHDQVEAMTLADRIVVFSSGTIEQIGKPLELYRNPSNLFVATFIGSPRMNIVSCKPVSDDSVELGNQSIIRSTRGCNAPETAMQLGIRPEHIDIVENGSIAGVIGIAELLGSDSFVHVDVDGVGTLVVRADPEREYKTGEKVQLQCRESMVYWFDEAGNTITNAV
jgi:multiple sugar transport system ATP-binding protein